MTEYVVSFYVKRGHTVTSTVESFNHQSALNDAVARESDLIEDEYGDSLDGISINATVKSLYKPSEGMGNFTLLFTEKSGGYSTSIIPRH